MTFMVIPYGYTIVIPNAISPEFQLGLFEAYGCMLGSLEELFLPSIFFLLPLVV